MRWSYACYGKANSFAQMNCPWGTRVSLRKIAFGSKADPSCPLETDFFTPLGCCIPECGDCLVEDTGFRKHILQQSACDGKPGCSVRAQRSSTAGCGTKPFTNYMVVMYECIPGRYWSLFWKLFNICTGLHWSHTADNPFGSKLIILCFNTRFMQIRIKFVCAATVEYCFSRYF